MNDERSLGDPVEPEPDPSTYNVADFAAGIRPGRRSVIIEPRPGLYPELQSVVRLINEAPEDADVDDLVDQFERIKSLMRVEWVVERRSPEWVKEFYAECREEMGIAGDVGVKDVLTGRFTDEQAVEVAMRSILAQTVTPDGWTLDMLRDLREVAPEQLDILADAIAKVNAGHSEALTLDFSQRRSTNRATRRSSTS